MKKLFLFIFHLCFTLILQAQVSKTVNINAGGLYAAFASNEINSITNLTIKGTINANDFQTIRNRMRQLITLNLSEVNVISCTTRISSIEYIEITDYPANAIPKNAFYNEYIGPNTNLTSIILPSSITVIGSYAFKKCSALTSIIIPNSVDSIKEGIFYDCSSLNSVTIPSTISAIPDYTFSGCRGLTSIIIPSSVKNIGAYSFYNCSALTSITIPNSVTLIKNHSFDNCSAITSVIIPSSITSIEDETFSNCSALTSVTIPNSITKIGYGAFSECLSIKSITIPSSVTFIDANAFSNCKNLVSIYAYPITPIVIPYEIFSFVNTNICILHVPSGSEKAYKSANQWRDFKHIMKIANAKL